MPTKRIAFDVNAALPAAWDQLWAENLKQRKDDLRYEKKVGKRAFNWARTYYITAASMERLIREMADKVAWAQVGNTAVYRGVRFSGNLQRTIHDWLFGQARRGVLTYHNFGKGHISGARFRPVGQPMAEAEQQTVARNAKRRTTPRVRHYIADGSLACMKPRKRSIFSRHRSTVRTTKNKLDVTCPRCRNLLGLGPYLATTSTQHEASATA
jgi:hypothetical protein